jgi:hypothetical protein
MTQHFVLTAIATKLHNVNSNPPVEHMETKLREHGLLAHFDRLVEQGVVVYNQNYRTITLSDRGVPVSLLIPCLAPHHSLTLTSSSSNSASSLA